MLRKIYAKQLVTSGPGLGTEVMPFLLEHAVMEQYCKNRLLLASYFAKMLLKQSLENFYIFIYFWFAGSVAAWAFL